MSDVTLEIIAERLERIQAEQASMCAAMADMAADQTMLIARTMLGIEVNIVQVRDHLGRIDARIARLESAPETTTS
jgi:hypothetical protein